MQRIILKDIIAVLSGISFIGDEHAVVDNPINLDKNNLNPNVLMWANAKSKAEVKHIKFGTIICPELPSEELSPSCNYFFSSEPRKTFATILRKFFVENSNSFISTKSSIHGSVLIGENCTINDFCVIHENVVIGNNVSVGNNSVVLNNTIIGNDVVIGCNCTIGGVGFGYEKDDDGSYVLLPHIGNVIIKDWVEIGNNTTIDRAVMGSTILHENVKVDNLVHIAHGVIIGKNSLIIANAMIAGSTEIGENVWVAPSSSIINKVKIGSNAIVGLGAVVVKSVSEADKVVGNPAKSIIK
jgi:UDP-3-O-[3-hydroxymyristoyl] glucosamine N-acyltransferase